MDVCVKDIQCYRISKEAVLNGLAFLGETPGSTDCRDELGVYGNDSCLFLCYAELHFQKLF